MPHKLLNPNQRRRLRAGVSRLAEALELGHSSSLGPAQRLADMCGVWLARLPDLRAARLGGYGAVNPALAGLLDPLLDELTQSLERLLKALEERGE